MLLHMIRPLLMTSWGEMSINGENVLCLLDLTTAIVTFSSRINSSFGTNSIFIISGKRERNCTIKMLTVLCHHRHPSWTRQLLLLLLLRRIHLKAYLLHPLQKTSLQHHLHLLLMQR